MRVSNIVLIVVPMLAASGAASAPEVQEPRGRSAVLLTEQKAPRIQEVLRLVGERRGGELSLDFLAGLPVREARDWLESLTGVGPKTSAAVLLFSRWR